MRPTRRPAAACVCSSTGTVSACCGASARLQLSRISLLMGVLQGMKRVGRTGLPMAG